LISSPMVDLASLVLLTGIFGIKVLGGGCKNCHTLMQNAIDALAELNRTDNVELVTDFSVIALYGVMSTPALVVNSKVVSVGKVLSKDEEKKDSGKIEKVTLSHFF